MEQSEQERLKPSPIDYRALWSEWGLHVASNGVPLLNLSNAVAVIEHDPDHQNLVRHDVFLQRIVKADGSEWGDSDDIELALRIQRNTGLNRLGRDLVSQAVIAVAHKRKVNCVQAWLDGLEHDGTQRLERFFSDAFGAEESEYVMSASRNFWLSMVSRIYRPGCKVDNMVVLEGIQGVGKSTALQKIGGDWYAEQHESATNPKAFAEILQGKMLIEISEMDAFSRAEVNRVKQTISCPSDRFRASYGRHASDHPRQCIFVGTTNRDDWNRDETGARRFWPIRCTTVNLALIDNMREQLFAEAVKRHKAGESHWEMPAESTKDEQESRFNADPWLEKIAEIIKGESSVTTAFVADKLNIPLERLDRSAQMRIGASLRFLRWGRKRARIKGSSDRDYAYFPSEVGHSGDSGDKLPF